MIGVLLPIYLSWADSVYVGGLKRYQTMGKLMLAMEMSYLNQLTHYKDHSDKRKHI